jgi:hypothetical protein
MRAITAFAMVVMAAAPTGAQTNTTQFGPWEVGCEADIMTDEVACWMGMPLGEGTQRSWLIVGRGPNGPALWINAPPLPPVTNAMVRYDRAPPMDWNCYPPSDSFQFHQCGPTGSQMEMAATTLSSVKRLAVRLHTSDGRRDHVVDLSETGRAIAEYERLLAANKL